jgi:hypothetical protein
VLREFGGGWVQCRDDQGIFYFNQVTQQSSDDVPPELRAAAQPPAVQPQYAASAYAQQAQVAQAAPTMEPKVKQKLGDWMICEDAQGEYYINARTQQTFDQAPAELVQLYQSTQQQQQAAAQPAQQQQKIKQQLGDWLICEDAQGEFYVHARTQQSFDQPPAELVQLYQRAQQQKAVTQPAAAQQKMLLQQQQQQAQLQQLKQQMQYQQPVAQNQYKMQYAGSAAPSQPSASATQYYQAYQQQQQQQQRYR